MLLVFCTQFLIMNKGKNNGPNDGKIDDVHNSSSEDDGSNNGNSSKNNNNKSSKRKSKVNSVEKFFYFHYLFYAFSLHIHCILE